MSRTAYDSVLSFKALDKAWKKLYNKTKPSSRNTIGVDNRSINDFKIDEKGNLVRLHKALADRDFFYSRLNPYLIPKPNGKKRLICVPTVEDRIVQGALLDFLSTKYEKTLGNPINFGFIKGKGVAEAAKQAQILRSKFPYVFKTDITSFFDSIPRGQLEAAIRRIIRESSLHQLLFQALASEVAETSKSIKSDLRDMGIICGKGIRQGMPLSPFFSNLLLVDFDRKVHSSGLRAVRYADDLIFLCSTELDCRRALAFCKKEFSKIELSVPDLGGESKSQIFFPTEPAEFLGLELALVNNGYVLRISTQQLKKIEQAMLSFSNIADVVSRGITLRNVGQKVAAKRAGYLAAYSECHNISELEKVLHKSEARAFKTLFGQGLGIRIREIGAVGRAFLGIVE